MRKEERDHNISVKRAVKVATGKALLERLIGTVGHDFRHTVNIYASREAYKLVDSWMKKNGHKLQKTVAKECRRQLAASFKHAMSIMLDPKRIRSDVRDNIIDAL